jgi:hypothetical protein
VEGGLSWEPTRGGLKESRSKGVRSGVAGGGDGQGRRRAAMTVESGVGAWRLDGDAEKGSEE